jgi:ATP-binding cassette subfamily B protein
MSELALPYITKITIDTYIIPQTSDKTTKDNHQHSGKQRYLILTSEQIDQPKIQAIINKHSELFEKDQGQVRIPYSLLESLDARELRLIRHNDLSGINWMVALFVGIIILNFALQFVQKIMMEFIGQNIIHDLRMHLYAHTQRLPLAFFNRHPLGRLVTRLTNDVQNMYEFFTNFMTFFIKDFFMFLGITIILLTLNWQLALITLAVLPLMIIISKIFARQSRSVFRILRIKLAEINSMFSETISGIRIIQFFQQEDNNSRTFSRLNHENYQAGMLQIRVLALFLPVIEALGFVSIGLVIFFGGQRVTGQTLSIGALVAFISYIRMFFRPVRDMAEKFTLMQNALASAERIFLIFDTKPKEANPVALNFGTAQHSQTRIETLECRQVSFSYSENTPVLKEISFTLRPFEHVAVVGPTGSGKTTLIHLLLGFYSPSAGQLLINNQDITTWDINLLRSRSALVMQESILFSGTIRQNILQGNLSLDDQKLDDLVELSHFLGFISRLPYGVDTHIGEGGLTLSSGQKQLISMARALARNPDLLILDEATSAIDSESERSIQEALKELMHNRTTITIAHRLATAQMADRILVLHKGHLVEMGTHNELMQARGLYFKLAQMQNS